MHIWYSHLGSILPYDFSRANFGPIRTPPILYVVKYFHVFPQSTTRSKGFLIIIFINTLGFSILHENYHYNSYITKQILSFSFKVFTLKI